MGYRDRDDSIRDRDKKSFSELDKQRRDRQRSGQPDRSEEGRSQKQLESSKAYNTYKRQLERAFDGGGLPQAMKEKLGETDVGKTAKARKAALVAITEASAPAQIIEALNAFRAEHGFPEDETVLAKLLELQDHPVIVAEALRTIATLHAAGTLKRGASLKARVKTVKMVIDDDEVVALATDLLTKL
jgi:hypothetical protein